MVAAVPAVSATQLAELAVSVGANVQPDQIVGVSADLSQHAMVREVAVAAYRRGARFVDVSYFDPYVKRARIDHAREETLDFVPTWLGHRTLELGRQRAANIALAGPSPQDALEGADPMRAGRDQLPFVKESMTVVNDRTVNWTIIPCPTDEWATLVYPELDPADALETLWRDVAVICRLDHPRPADAWEARMAELTSLAGRLTDATLDAVHFEGVGTDLTIGLLPTSSWEAGGPTETVDGISHLPNLPSEEVFTTPDPERADGVVRSTRPLMLGDGSRVDGLEVRFEAGMVTGLRAEKGEAVLQGRVAIDAGASRLGEVGLVDRTSPISRLGRVFYETLIDENAVSHIALGDGYDNCVAAADRPRVNRSGIHIDFMVGDDEVDVTGVTRDGTRVPVLRNGAWQL
jgi:aminopeptidase